MQSSKERTAQNLRRDHLRLTPGVNPLGFHPGQDGAPSL